MSIIFFSDVGNITLKCIFSGQDYPCSFGKRVISYLQHLYVYTEYIIFAYIFWKRSPFIFCPKKKYFQEKRNNIFADITRKTIFQCDFFRKTIFSEHLKKISYFYKLFGERSSFLFRLKNKIIFSGQRNIIFPDNTRKIIFQWDFFRKITFTEQLEKENMVFRTVVSFGNINCYLKLILKNYIPACDYFFDNINCGWKRVL